VSHDETPLLFTRWNLAEAVELVGAVIDFGNRQTVLRAGLGRCSLHGVERIFDVTRQTVARWISTHIQNLPEEADTLLPASPDDVLELDAVLSFVLKKDGTRWLWTAMCRRTRQIVAFAIGDRSKAACLRLWKAIPNEYKHCHTFK